MALASDTAKQFVGTNGIQLAYVDHASQHPLVLLPGISGNTHQFTGLIRAGLNRDQRVITVDLRGRGLSSKPDSGYSVAEHAADVIGFLDALGLEQVVLGGHSFGGLVAAYIAAQQPRRVSHLVLLDSVMALAGPAKVAVVRPALSRLGAPVPSWEAYIAGVRQLPIFRDYWDDALETFFRADVAFLDDGSVRSHASAETMLEALEGLQDVEWKPVLYGIEQPALLVHATDPIAPPNVPAMVSDEEALETLTLLGDVTYVRVSGNHSTMLFGPHADQVVEAINTFLRQDQ